MSKKADNSTLSARRQKRGTEADNSSHRKDSYKATQAYYKKITEGPKHNELGGKPVEKKAVAETFEKELEQIKENAKELKGTNKSFYDSIVARVENNVRALADLREEHTHLREKLNQLIAIKKERSRENDLAHDIKHAIRDVNNLQRKIDNIKHEKEASINRQNELLLMLKNYAQGENQEHPELAKITSIKNKLDKASIKIDETKHLIKIYNRIIQLFDKQKMQWTPLLQKRLDEINRKNRDISELFLVARDSKHSQVTAQNEYVATDRAINEAITKRERALETKEMQYKSIISNQPGNLGPEDSRRNRQSSMPSQSSILRQRANKANRELKEEKNRAATAKVDSIFTVFGTVDPKEIAKIIKERKKTSTELHKQIEELKNDIESLKEIEAQLSMEVEEKEFTQARGIGGQRLLTEGKAILDEKKNNLKYIQRTIEAFDGHQKSVLSGVDHLQDVLALVTMPDDNVPSNPIELLKWCAAKAKDTKEFLNNEDANIADIVNKAVLQQQRMAQQSFDLTKIDSSKRIAKRVVDPLKRPPKENKNDDTTRVLDRNAVKALARAAQPVVVIKKPHLMK